MTTKLTLTKIGFLVLEDVLYIPEYCFLFQFADSAASSIDHFKALAV